MGVESNSGLNLLHAYYLLISTTLKQGTAAVPTLRMSQQRPIDRDPEAAPELLGLEKR